MGWLGGLLGLGSTIVGAEYAKKQQEKEQAFNAEQAQITRDFNASEAEKARQFNANESELARQYNTAEREAAQEWNLEQWNRENEYNSPVEQMKRMTAAGINPNLAASSISGGTASSVTTSGASSGAASGPAASGPAASGPSIAGNLADLIGNSANNIMSNALVSEQIESLKIDNIWKDREKRVAYRQAKQILANSELEGEEKKLALKLQQQLYDQNELTNPLALKQMQESINKLTAEQELIRKQQNTEEARKENIEAHTEVLGSQVGQIEAQTRKANEEANKLAWENLFRKQYGFDPSQGWVQQLITSGAEGTLPNIFKEIVKSVTPDDLEEGAKNLGKSFKGDYDWSNDWFVNKGKKLYNWMIKR